MPPVVRAVLGKLGWTDMEENLPIITGNITPEEFRSVFAAVVEKTSSSLFPIGITLHHLEINCA